MSRSETAIRWVLTYALISMCSASMGAVGDRVDLPVMDSAQHILCRVWVTIGQDGWTPPVCECPDIDRKPIS